MLRLCLQVNRVLPVLALISGLSAFGCGAERSPEDSARSSSTKSKGTKGAKAGKKESKRRAPPLSALKVSHGDLESEPPEGAPLLASTSVAATIYKLPNENSRRLGYVRLGSTVPRDEAPVAGRGCKKGEWFRVYPIGYMCTESATTDLEDPLVRAASVRPELDKPLPYRYGFVRATAPQYLRIPTKAEQLKSEFGLEDHLTWYAEHKDEVQTVELGANDVALDERGVAVPGLPHPKSFRSSKELSRAELFGSLTAEQPAPFWLAAGKRAIPNVSAFKVPEYAVFADRVRRHTGLSFIGSFQTEDDGMKRGFGMTVDMRLIPTTKVKPDTGSAWHGMEVPKQMHFPFAFVTKRNSSLYKLLAGRDETRPAENAPHRGIVPLSGKARIKEGKRYYQTLGDKTRWLRASDIGVVHHPSEWPEPAEKG